MIEIKYESIKFTQTNDFIKAHFLKIFYFEIPNFELKKIAEFETKNGNIYFKTDDERRVNRRFQSLLNRFFPKLINSITKKPSTYIHQNSSIPLIGTNYFGLVDRGTNIIEIKPMNGCNLDCIYCSVDENQRERDFVVEEEYLSDSFFELLKIKKSENIEAHIAGQCEPTLYQPLHNLIKNIAKNKQVKTISIDTNGMLLTKEKINQLIDAGLNRINLSINSLNQKNAEKIANGNYDTEKIKEIATYISQKIDLIIAPVFMKGINKKDIEEIIKFTKKLQNDKKTKGKIQLGIQNFLRYKTGKKPAKQIDFNYFFKLIDKWSKQYEIDLKNLEIVFEKDNELPKPFKKDDTIFAEFKTKSRFKDEIIVASENRSIVIPNCRKRGRIKIKITGDKDNIFFGKF